MVVTKDNGDERYYRACCNMERRFRACFGARSEIVADLWNWIEAHGAPIEEPGGKPKHLLWTLWAWYYFVGNIAALKDDVISLENRIGGLNGVAETKCFTSHNGPAINKYEVGVCLKTGWIVWINGPFVGSANNATIFKEGLSLELYDDEAVELPDMGMSSKERKTKSNARAQHETVNGRLNIFNVITSHFRHMTKPNRQGMTEKHGKCFIAVAVITQLKFASGETTFEDGLEYNVNYF
eukprot:jgi/Psemu1/52082/gm1.52082_g